MKPQGSELVIWISCALFIFKFVEPFIMRLTSKEDVMRTRMQERIDMIERDLTDLKIKVAHTTTRESVERLVEEVAELKGSLKLIKVVRGE